MSEAKEAEDITPADRASYADIKGRIGQLIELSGEDLSSQMTLLKQALKENPNACKLMLPEDIGGIVAALQRITGKYLIQKATQKKDKVPKMPKGSQALNFTAEELDEL